MLSQEQQSHLKLLLLDNQKDYNDQLENFRMGTLEDSSQRDSVGELSAYDNHPADMGTELYEREKDFALEEHTDSELNKVNEALKAMEEGMYGQCKVCGKDIPYERLEIIPSTLYCVEHSPEQNLPTDRPVEEEVLEPAHGNHFQHIQFREFADNEDSFQEVARYGTSETPSDLKGDYENYGSLYNEGHDDEGFTEDYETFVATDITGKNTLIYSSKKHEEYEDMLDEEGIEAPFGDVPYHYTDGYVDDVKDDK